MNKIFLIYLLLVSLISSCQTTKSLPAHEKEFYAQKTKSQIFVDENNNQLPYRLFLPDNYTPEREYPLILSFHGAGERGNDNLKQLEPWVAGWIDGNVQKENPCIFLMPQCPEGMQWVNVPWGDGSYSILDIPMSEPMRLAKKIFDKIIKEYSVDKNRIYVMGASMGGYATWNFILNYPDIVAAAVPVCGAGDPSMSNRIKSIPIWAFHGDRDKIVPLSGTTDMIDELMRINKNVEMTIYKNVGHEAYDMAWKELKLIRWIFEQKKR